MKEMFRLTAHYQVHDLAKDQISKFLVEPVLEIAHSDGFRKDFDEKIVTPDFFINHTHRFIGFNSMILHTLTLKDTKLILKRLYLLKTPNIIILCHNARSLSNFFRNLLLVSGLCKHEKACWVLPEDVMELIAEKYKKTIIGNCFIAPELIDLIPFVFLKKPLLQLNASMENKFQNTYIMTKLVARNFLVYASIR